MKGVFSEVKVLDFSWGIAGPQSTKYLSDQGATVIRIETVEHADLLRTSPPFAEGRSGVNRSGYYPAFNPNKLGLGINIKHAQGIKIVKKLVTWADVITESFAPGVMESLGLGYEELRRIKPDIIMLSTSTMGSQGTRSQLRAIGMQLIGYNGFVDITGWPDRTPVPCYGPYTDIIAPRFSACCLIAALLHRKETGEGCWIDVSQYEAGIHFLGPLLLDYQVNKRLQKREGNTSRCYCPHGVYPCQGQDRWIAIAVRSDREWQTFSNLINHEWARSTKFATFSSRKENEVELDKLIASWTIQYIANELMQLLQEKGIPAGVVQNAKDLCEDDQLLHRKALWSLEHKVIGSHLAFGQEFVLTKSPPPPPREAPCLGEHTFYVCKEIIGMPDEEIVQLINEGVLQVEV